MNFLCWPKNPFYKLFRIFHFVKTHHGKINIFRQINDFTKDVTKALISRNFLSVIALLILIRLYFCLLPHVNILQLLCTGYIYKNVLITMYRYPDIHSSSIISREKGKSGRHVVHDSDTLTCNSVEIAEILSHTLFTKSSWKQWFY